MAKELRVLALTGGIATGKSTACKIIKKLVPEVVIFDADLAVARLYSSRDVLVELKESFGGKILLSSGEVDKRYLRTRIFSKVEAKKKLEAIFHPRVKNECLALLQKTITNGASHLFVADIPLLFEGEGDFGQTANLLVATTRETQIKRLKKRNAWGDELVEAVLRSQMPIEEKLALADTVFWNEGSEDILSLQIARFFALDALGE